MIAKSLKMVAILLAITGSGLGSKEAHAVYNDCIHGGYSIMAQTWRVVTTFTQAELSYPYLTGGHYYRVTSPELWEGSAIYTAPPSYYGSPRITWLNTNYNGQGQARGQASTWTYSPEFSSSHHACGYTSIASIIPAF